MLYTVLYMASVRTQIYLTPEQRRRLDARRRAQRRPLAALIREALDVYLTEEAIDPAAALDGTFGSLPRLEVPSRAEWDRD